MNGPFISQNRLATALLIVLIFGLFVSVWPENQASTPEGNTNATQRAPESDSGPRPASSSPAHASESLLSLWNAIVQTLVLAVIFFYTYQTRKMQMAMVRQIKLSVMPSFTLELVQLNVIDPTLEVSTYALQITNIGSGTALNIEIQPIFLRRLVESRRKVGAPNLRFIRLGLLRRADTTVVKHQSFSEEQLVDEDYIIDFEDGLIADEGSSVDLTIIFQDIEGDNYRQRIRMTSNGCEPEAVIPR